MLYDIAVRLYAKKSTGFKIKLHNKFVEASDVCNREWETISSFVMQHHQDKWLSANLRVMNVRLSLSIPFKNAFQLR